MAAVLLDTDVFSYLLKDDARADPYRPHVRGERLVRSLPLFRGTFFVENIECLQPHK